MTDWPRISIVTPSYNQAPFLEQTICSVLDQGYPNLEYFIMDGGSTDGSVEIIRKYARYFTYWVSEKDRGHSHAINKGFQRASGNILAFINSDDYYLPGAFRYVAQEYLHQPFDLLAGTCHYVDVDGNLMQVVKRYPSCLMDFMDIPRAKHVFLTQPEVFLNRKVFEKIGGFREDIKYAIDREYWIRTMAAGFSIYHITDDLACFRVHDGTKTSDEISGYISIIGFVREYMQKSDLYRLDNRDLFRIRKGIQWAIERLNYLKAYKASQNGDLITAFSLWFLGTVSYFPFCLLDLSSLRWWKKIVTKGYDEYLNEKK